MRVQNHWELQVATLQLFTMDLTNSGQESEIIAIDRRCSDVGFSDTGLEK